MHGLQQCHEKNFFVGVDGMLVQLGRPEFGLDGVDLGSWCHCLPVGMRR